MPKYLKTCLGHLKTCMPACLRGRVGNPVRGSHKGPFGFPKRSPKCQEKYTQVWSIGQLLGRSGVWSGGYLEKLDKYKRYGQYKIYGWSSTNGMVGRNFYCFVCFMYVLAFRNKQAAAISE